MASQRSASAVFVNAVQTVEAFECMLSRARKFILLVTPFVRLSQNCFERLLVASRRGIRITVVCRESKLESVDRLRLEQMNAIIRDSPRVHAKCYASEREIVLTSLNLDWSSQVNNWEMGVHASSSHEIYKNAMAEVNQILRAASGIVRLNTSTSGAVPPAQLRGFCIAKKHSKEFEAGKPLCVSCWQVWKDEGADPELVHRFCYQCGSEANTTVAQPFCAACRARP